MSDAPTADTSEDLAESTDDEAAFSILSSGTPLRCLARLPAALADEVRVTFDHGGIRMAGVDPANVGMFQLTAHAEGFESYRVRDPSAEVTVGVSIDRLQSALGFARMRGDGDPVSLDVFTDPDRIRVSVTRPDQGLQRQEEWFCIDPDRIRQEPETPDFDLPCYADPDVAGFRDGVHAFEPDHAEVRNDGKGGLVLGAEGDRDDGEPGLAKQSVVFPNSVWLDEEADEEIGASSLFSLGYLEDISEALKTSRADRLTVNWGEQFPVLLEFQHEDWGYEGLFAVAPRIKQDGDTA